MSRRATSAAIPEKEVISHINKSTSDKVNTIDVTDVLIAKKNDGLYYKTDHHWKTKAAYYTFRQYAAYKGITPVNYDFYDVTGSFQGTQSSNSGVYSTYETVTIGVPDNSIGTYTVEYVKEGKKTTSLFDDSKLKEKHCIYRAERARKYAGTACFYRPNACKRRKCERIYKKKHGAYRFAVGCRKYINRARENKQARRPLWKAITNLKMIQAVCLLMR